MKLRGLATHPACAAFFSEAYGVEAAGAVAGISIWRDREGQLFAGGYKNLYTVAEGDVADALRELASWRAGKPFVRYAFSTEQDIFCAKRRHFILRIREGAASAEAVRALYKSKTRNQVRKSERFIEDVRVEYRPEAFYDLYCRSIRRLGSVPRPLAWFERLERHFGDDVRTANAYHDGELIASNYYIRSGDYALLLFNVSDERFWQLDPNDRVYDAYVRQAASDAVRFVDFGPGMAADASHTHFKLGFGARPHFMADRLYATPIGHLRELWRNHSPRMFRLLGLRR